MKLIIIGALSILTTSAWGLGPKEGVYLLKGNSAANPQSHYHGSVTVARDGTNYRLKWRIGKNQTQSGVAILAKDVLSVGYYDDSGKDFGVVSFRVKSAKKMEGQWAPLGAAASGKETLEWAGEENEATWNKINKTIDMKWMEEAQRQNSLEGLEDRLKIAKDPEEKFDILASLMQHYSHISLKDKALAKERAAELLRTAANFKKDWNYGNAIHRANLVLGRVSLLNGDLDGAKKHLKAAGLTPGSPQLNSFGPNMMLAKELLEKGERNAVLDYLADIGKFWSGARSAEFLEEWKAAVQKGQTPNFESHLLY